LFRNAAAPLILIEKQRCSRLRDWQRKAPDRLILQSILLN
jgi:hypothetical protein